MVLAVCSAAAALSAWGEPSAIRRAAIWNCAYVAQPDPALACRRVTPADAAAKASPGPAPLWGGDVSAPGENVVLIPLYAPPRDKTSSDLRTLARTTMCADEPACYVLFPSPAATPR